MKVDANPTGGTAGWAEFLRSKPGRPIHIVADQDKGIIGGVVAAFGLEADRDLIHHCEHHLLSNAGAAFDSDKLPTGDDIRRLFRDALTSDAGWDAFEAAVLAREGLRLARARVDRWGPKLRMKASRRADRPLVYANCAVESALAQVRNLMQPRIRSHKNRARTKRLLDLFRFTRVGGVVRRHDREGRGCLPCSRATSLVVMLCAAQGTAVTRTAAPGPTGDVGSSVS